MRRLLWAVPVVIAVLSAGMALTAGNTISQDMDSDNDSRTQGVGDVTPSPCANLAVNARQSSNSLSVNGGSGNDFLMGGSASQEIAGLGGNDCIYAGGGNDTIDGGTGTNVINGGPGTDTCLNAVTKLNCEL